MVYELFLTNIRLDRLQILRSECALSLVSFLSCKTTESIIVYPAAGWLPFEVEATVVGLNFYPPGASLNRLPNQL